MVQRGILPNPMMKRSLWLVLTCLLIISTLSVPAGIAGAGVPIFASTPDPPADIRSMLGSGRSPNPASPPAGGRTLEEAPAGAQDGAESVARQTDSDTLTSVADTCVLQGYADSNFGTAGDMWAGYDDYLDPDGEIARSLVQFNLSGLPAGQEITEAMLRLYAVGSWEYPGRSDTIRVRRATSEWVEGSVTWNSKPGFAEEYDSVSIPHEGVELWYEFDVTDLVHAWRDGTYSNHGIMILGEEASGADSSWRSFGTRESEVDPELVITYGASNTPPDAPTAPSPADGATGVSTDAQLSWTGGDPDESDTVTYDVYLAAGTEPAHTAGYEKNGNRVHSWLAMSDLGSAAAPQASTSALGDILWDTATDMPTARAPEIVEAGNGKLYAIGGYDGSDYVATVEEYDPTTDSWTTKADMPTARSGMGLAATNGKLYAIGGYNGSRLSTVEVYDPASDSWTVGSDMPTPRSTFGLAAANGTIYAIGGQTNSGEVGTVEAYDPIADSWTTKSSMPTPRSALGVALASDGWIYAVGGGSDLATVEAYDPAADAWAARADMPTGRDALGLAAGINGKLYAIGGTSTAGGLPDALNVVEAYEPATDTWITETGLPADREYPGAVGTSGGKIYVVGGVTDRFSLHGGATYHRTVYETTLSPFQLVCNDLSDTTCDPGPLDPGTQYAWYVVATDSQEASTTGDTWGFTTAAEANSPPYEPTSPSPTDGAMDVPTDAQLSWTGGDPDEADTVSYDVYLEAGAAEPSVLVCNDRSEATCDPGPLDPGTQYAWYVVATDSQEASTTGDTWDFTTAEEGGTVYLPLIVKRYPPIPDVPVLNPISNPDSDGEYTVDWNPADLAETYVLEEDDNPAFSSPTERYSGPDTDWDATDKTPGTYHYRVKARNVWADSGWSTIRSVTVAMTEIMWSTRASMPTARTTEVVQAANGKIYAIGGYNGSRHVATVEEYDPATNTWRTRANMPTARGGLGVAAADNGKIYAIGGYNGSTKLATVEEYDPATNSWATRASMPTPRTVLEVVAAANGKIYAIGGVAASGTVGTVEEYDPATNSWRTRASMPTARSGFGAAAATNGKIYAIGDMTTVEEYDPATNNWTTRTSLPTGRSVLGAAAGTNGKIYAIGGMSTSGGGFVFHDTVEAYDPATDTWTTDTSLPGRREYPAVVGASNGKIYVVGGVTGRFYSRPTYYRTVFEGTLPPTD